MTERAPSERVLTDAQRAQIHAAIALLRDALEELRADVPAASYDLFAEGPLDMIKQLEAQLSDASASST